MLPRSRLLLLALVVSVGLNVWLTKNLRESRMASTPTGMMPESKAAEKVAKFGFDPDKFDFSGTGLSDAAWKLDAPSPPSQESPATRLDELPSLKSLPPKSGELGEGNGATR